MSTTAVRAGLVAAIRAIRASGRPGVRASGPETRSCTILSPCHRRPRRDSRPSSAASGWFASASASSAAVAASPASPVDRNDPRFATEVEVLAVRAPRSAVGGLMAKLRRHTIDRPRLNRVQHLDDDHSLVLLDTGSCPVDGDRDALPSNVLDALASCPGTGEDACVLVTHSMILGYDDLDADECLRRVLPPDVTVPTGFETAGRIVHLNLRDEHEPWKRVIAAVLIDKLPQIETVVNKTGETGGPFRTFAMEVLAGRGGDGPLETTVSENGLVYAMDFRGMYWNSRLGTERGRLVDSFDENDVVLDLCCGVGPIALPASKKCLAVYANDLNPAAVAYLGRNASRNKGTSLAGVTNLDAGECLRARIAELSAALAAGESNLADERDLFTKMRFTRVVMNLPQGSLELLPCFVGAFDRETWPPESLPIIDAYAFSKSDDPESDVGARAAKELGLEEDAAALGDGVGYRRVRLVAPGKHMMLVSFKLPERAAYAER